MRALTIAVLGVLLTASAAQAAGDPARGKVAFGQCSGCHTVIANTRDSMGPNLFGVVGRRAGTKPGFAFSDAVKKSGIVWDEASLKKFVMDPNGTVPGTNMFFTGIANAKQAEDVAAYLASLK